MRKFNLSSDSSGQRTDRTDASDFPEQLKEYDRWLVTVEKRPAIPSKGWQYPDNLLGFAEARERAGEIGGAVAFCFTEQGPFVGFDLDDVWESGEFTDEAEELVEWLDSYTEYSSSGEGLHIIAEGELEEDRKTTAELSEAGHLEAYDSARYFVLTGDVYDGFTSVESRLSVARAVQEDHLPESQTSSSTGQQKPVSKQEFDGGDTNVTPERVRGTIEVYGRSNNASVDGDRILRLWRGSGAGYPSKSEADMAFVAQLYFWCKGDQQLMDDCFRASRRMRPKWDNIHSSDGTTYGEMTIQKVCRSNRETFGGQYVERG